MQIVTTKNAPTPTIPFHGKEKHVSFILCMNAAGDVVAETFIHAGVRSMEKYLQYWPEAHLVMTESGFQTAASFYEWAKIFVQQTGGNCALILDNHSSRFDIRAIALFR